MDSAIHKASELPPEARRVVESLVGRVLHEDDHVSVRVFKGNIISKAPAGRDRDEAYARLRERIDKTASRAVDVPEKEMDDAIDEAVDFVRHHRE